MITSLRIGRYGNTCNSMFQFAALIGMAKKCGLEYGVPHNPTYFEPGYGCMNISIFDGFEIDCPIITSGEFQGVEFPFVYVNTTVEDNTDIQGFFQSEKYFENAKEEVAKQFTFKEEVKEVVDQKIKDNIYHDPNDCTTIHIRRGDYANLPNHHPASTGEYYAKASKLAATKHFMVFSDDIKYCKQVFRDAPNAHYSEEDNPFSALYHMSLCKNNIICNSSFGWWGAWLGEMAFPDKERIIVAPTKWFGPGHAALNPKDIIPERWIKI